MKNEIPVLRDLDLYYGQDKRRAGKSQGYKTLVVTPSLYFEYEVGEINTRSKLAQQAGVKIHTYLISTNLYDNDKRIEKVNPDDHMQLVDDVYASLQARTFALSVLEEFEDKEGTDEDYLILNSLSRIAYKDEVILSDIMVTKQTFRARLNDYAALRKYEKKSTSLGFSGIITVSI